MSRLRYTLVKQATFEKIRSSLQTKETQISSATVFVKEIERGNLDAQYTQEEVAGNEVDALSVSLQSMRDQMKKFSQEEKERNWATEGLAKFVDILRSKNEDLSTLSDNIIRHLVKYMGANQGALYLVNDDDQQDVFIEMSACYAYDRKKHMHQRIALGEGLVGQVVLEQATLYMTDIPKNFVRITSGLGDALPRNLLIVPLKIEEKVFGVVEMASFEPIKSYQREFVEKLGESIAATISAAKVSDRTSKLLHETQVQAEQMKSQEEEMRQNMEELSATQEEMHRVLKEVQGKERYMNELIDSSNDAIATVDRSYRVQNFNKSFRRAVGGDLEKGFDMLSLLQGEQKVKNKSYYDRAFKGETFEVTDRYETQGHETYYVTSYSPLRDEKGEIVSVALFAKDATLLIRAQKETERLLEESKNQFAYFNDALNGLSDSILTVDKNYTIVLANSMITETFGKNGVNLSKGASVLTLAGAGNVETFKTPYDRAFKGEQTKANKSYFGRDFEVHYGPLKNSQGEVIGASLVAHDITEATRLQQQTDALLKEAQQQAEELKAQEEEIRQNMEELSATQDEMQRVLGLVQDKEAYLSALLNAYNDAIVTVDLELNIVMFNQYLAKTFQAQGLTVETGMSVFALSHPDQQEHSRENYRRVLQGETITENQEYFGKFYEITTLPLYDREGKISGACVFTKDITTNVQSVKAAQLEKDRANTAIAEQEEKFNRKEAEYQARIAELENQLRRHVA
ncbi:PAS domain-containing protein [Chryseolinea lacunae]|uniref:PAS domain-containing protein n=1 Tax=Chryseolinea lacunae TaxID=2801331 RepID=A0ABS1KYM4_9BACT|nr:PAS domain-containing protein [Chryseolinea lacunae]MBL0744551.1 PAS domain-containing protein [Chryseolinea lacunae]